jgi:hypothetical protein
MKCSGSQTICTAPDRDPSVAAAQTLQALIFAKILEPLAKPLGPVGEIALTSVAQRMFAPKNDDRRGA